MPGQPLSIRALSKPIAFQPLQVTTIISGIYLLLLTIVLYVHIKVPAAPQDEAPFVGLNQTQAWRDLQELSRDFRPFNSHRNDEIREWLVDRTTAIVLSNNRTVSDQHKSSDVVIWEDLKSNVTFVDSWRNRPWTCYIESENVMVYVRGVEDEPDAWWERPFQPKQGLLINAHYDSVSTGYGATDDGCGVVTILQLISYYSIHTPRKGIIFLLNNGEEDGLYGAHAFAQHPWSSFAGSFLNLEGAGAGGRATLFRSTDADITSFYASSPHPFGTVLSADGFKRGLVRSGTDYSVFTDDLDLRGLDVAFMEPRSRYHTNQDGAKDTSRDSLWHMLSAALSTTRAMDQHQGNWDPLSTSKSDAGVWFDLLGTGFAVFTLRTFSILSIISLIVGPLLLGLLVVFLIYLNKWYPFLPRDTEHGKVSRWRGVTRTPVALVASILVLLALDYLVEVQNPYIVYRSPYLVWSTFTSAFLLVTWAVLRLADHIRPTVFTRWYAILWIYIISWAALIGATHSAMASAFGSGYFVLIYHISALAALIVGTLEFFALPQRQDKASDEADQDTTNEVNERTSLLRDGQTFTGVVRQPEDTQHTTDALKRGSSDSWLGLPTWTWMLQFLLLGPINIILVGQIGLFLMSALHQTPADGNDISFIYQSFVGCSILLLVPTLPFLHKLRPVIPFLLLIVLTASIVWSTLAFPFDREARLKYYFLQEVDLKTGVNKVSLSAISPFLESIAAEMPSAAGQELVCRPPGEGLRNGLSTCTWHGLHPKVIVGAHEQELSSWLHWNVELLNETSARFIVQGNQTKNCRITFDTPVHGISILDGAQDPRHAVVAELGSTQLRLFGRDWDKRFEVTVSWDDTHSSANRTGRVGCMWAEYAHVPAVKELQTFAPTWSALTKNDDGLVEGWYDWSIQLSSRATAEESTAN
ncbi:hypothetical protein AMS68_001311 [Peltaster fructicola]|uniref:Peptide hydrolase n=1 Tax=Peltaster fructicola TaxID=286661 RepID=A0A6H0XM43_9PEZI|nr:hypothetical protein AMS68_001311 [Peltaster fructicola]